MKLYYIESYFPYFVSAVVIVFHLHEHVKLIYHLSCEHL